jgi:TPR repeat protein
MTDMQAQLGKIRSDAAECLVLSGLADSERKEMFAKMAEHLNGLALEIEKKIAADGPVVPFVGHRLAESIIDPSSALGLPAVSNTSAAAYQAKRSHRLLPWLLIIVATLITGVFFWTNENAETFLSLLTVQSKQETPPLLPQNDAKQVRLLSDDESGRRSIADQLGALAARVGSFEKALQDLKGDSKRVSSGADETTAPRGNLAIASRDRETKATLLDTASDEAAQSGKTAEATAAALQEGRKKTVASLQQEQEYAGGPAVPAAPAAPVAVATPIASPAAAPAPQPKRIDSGELAMLMKRAKGLLEIGDIPAARLLLERAAEDGQDASAALLLARTYDPVVLGTSDVRNIAPEPEKALAWYRKAAELGSDSAQQRLAQLGH